MDWLHMGAHSESMGKSSSDKNDKRVVKVCDATPSRRVFGEFASWIECAPDAFDVSDGLTHLFEREEVTPD